MIVNSISVVACAACFLYTFYVVCNLTYFLSDHNKNLETPDISATDENSIISVLWSLIVNMTLLSIFMVQHSIMAKDYVKYTFSMLQIEYMNRSIYNMVSAGTLHFLFNNWQPTPWISLWRVDTSSSTSLWLLFTVFHVIAWAIIYSGCLMMDISDLAGLKQVWYKITSRPSPVDIKSLGLLRYYEHMRHPSFSGFLIILWIHPFMTADRLLLASVLTVYMALMWRIDKEDYNYHANCVRIKQRALH